MRFSETVLAVALTATGTASAFSLVPSAAVPRAHTGLRAAVCAAEPEGISRRKLLAGLLSLPMAAAAPVQALKYDPNDKAAREEYLEDTANMKKARYGKQPTRLDVERNVKKIVLIKDTMTEANKATDAAGIAKAIGDLNIEATKKNVNLGKEIPKINIAKSYMYAYASCFSKGYDSPLTVDLKSAADAFYASMGSASEAANKGDLPGAKAALASANEALSKYVDAIEAETLGGRLNSIKISLKALVDDGASVAVDSYKANKQVQKDSKDKNFL